MAIEKSSLNNSRVIQAPIGLTQRQIDRIVQLKETFVKAERITGVPWEAVAAVWFRESFSVTPPTTPGGPFQFDPTPTDAALLQLLDRFTKLDMLEKEHLINRGINDFQAGAIFAACWLRHKCKPVLTPNSPEKDIADAFYGYNGRAYGSVDRSPYVMNMIDKEHAFMRLIGTIPDGKGGRKRVNTVDRRPGALKVYRQLKALEQVEQQC